MRKIYLSSQGWKNKNQFVVVDDSDFEFLNQWRWCVGNGGYAVTGNGSKTCPRIIMHRLIMYAPDNMEVDHINNNRLDNRRINLRLCTHKQNLWNSSLRGDNKSGYRGISWDKKRNKWRTRLTYNGREYYLGHFEDIREARLVYWKKANELFGNFAYCVKID